MQDIYARYLLLTIVLALLAASVIFALVQSS